MSTLILAGGGTAGHITPHLAILPLVKGHFDNIIYISSGKQLEHNLMNGKGVKIYDVKTPALKRSLSPKNLLIPIDLAKAIKTCKQILKKEGASVVFSKGGYCALPVCYAAFALKIPVVCHESDLTLGLTTRLTYKKCDTLFTTFEKTAVKYGGVCSGPPLRLDLLSVSKAQAKAKIGITNEKPTLLVTGGSQGSNSLNFALKQNLDEILRLFNVIHLYGNGNKPAYKPINGYFAFEFYDMNVALSACDFCLSRGGSNTLFELLYAKKPSIIVPLKRGSRGDQIKNATYFSRLQAVVMLDEDKLALNLLPTLLHLKENRLSIIKRISALKIKNGAEIIAQKLSNFDKNIYEHMF